MTNPAEDWEKQFSTKTEIYEHTKLHVLRAYGGSVMGYESIDDVLKKPPRGHTREMVMDNVFRTYLLFTMPPKPIVIEIKKQ